MYNNPFSVTSFTAPELELLDINNPDFNPGLLPASRISIAQAGIKPQIKPGNTNPTPQEQTETVPQTSKAVQPVLGNIPVKGRNEDIPGYEPTFGEVVEMYGKYWRDVPVMNGTLGDVYDKIVLVGGVGILSMGVTVILPLIEAYAPELAMEIEHLINQALPQGAI